MSLDASTKAWILKRGIAVVAAEIGTTPAEVAACLIDVPDWTPWTAEHVVETDRFNATYGLGDWRDYARERDEWARFGRLSTRPGRWFGKDVL